MRTLMEIGEVAHVDAFTDAALAEKRRLMGMGHRVYKAGDPRAAILRGMAEEACRQSGPVQVVRDGREAPRARQRRQGAHPQRRLLLGAALLLLGIPVDLFTPVIAAGRIAGLDRQHHRAARRQPPDPVRRQGVAQVGCRGPRWPGCG